MCVLVCWPPAVNEVLGVPMNRLGIFTTIPMALGIASKVRATHTNQKPKTQNPKPKTHNNPSYMDIILHYR